MKHGERHHDPEVHDAWWVSLFLRRADAWGPAPVCAGFGLILHDAVTPQTTLLLIAIACLYWFGYAINDYCDAALDAHDEHKARENFFVHHPVPGKVLVLAAVAIDAMLLGVFAMFGMMGVVLFAIGNLAMWGYSARPMRLKSKPGLDLWPRQIHLVSQGGHGRDGRDLRRRPGGGHHPGRRDSNRDAVRAGTPRPRDRPA
jgi:hypothetical protein